MSQDKLLILISTYNGKNNLPLLLDKAREVLKKHGICYKFLLVDDGSRDGSQQVLNQMASENKDINVLCFQENVGQQENLRRGLQGIEVMPESVVTMDDDGQHSPEWIPEMISKLREGYDLVYGIPEWSSGERPFFIRILGSALRDLLFQKVLHVPKDVKVSAYRIMTGTLAKRLAASSRPFFYLSAEAFQQPIQASNLFYPYRKRSVGVSSYSIKKLVQLYVKIWYHYGWKKY
jgi:undecaprenyl-phosphate 4-deoxy-4-formamido-L-arabinose transferase